MNGADAKFLLTAYRPGGEDAQEPEFREALEHTQLDPAVRVWLEREQRADRLIAGALQSVPVPPDLRSVILAGAKISRERPWFADVRLMALAASVLFCAFIAAFFAEQKSSRGLAGWQTAAIETVAAVVSGRRPLDLESPRLEEVQAWLAHHDAPRAAMLPGRLPNLKTVGCKTIVWENQTVSIICFHRPDGELVHLATIARTGLRNAPPLYRPSYAIAGEWATVSWSEGDLAVMLFTKGKPADLQTLLAIVPPLRLF